MYCIKLNTYGKYIYVLICYARTNVNYFSLKYRRNIITRDWWLNAQAIQPRKTSQSEQIRDRTMKKLRITRRLKIFGSITAVAFHFLSLSFSCNFRSMKLFLIFWVGGKISSDSYSWTTSQLSLILSAILTNFWRFLISFWPSSTNFRTLAGLSTLSSNWDKLRLLKREFNSNSFLFPLNFIVEAFSSSLALSYNLFPLAGTLKGETTWLTNCGFVGSFWPSKLASSKDDSCSGIFISPTVDTKSKTPEWKPRARGINYSSWTLNTRTIQSQNPWSTPEGSLRVICIKLNTSWK